MNGQNAFLPDVGKLCSADGWISIHHYLPLASRTSLLVVYQDMHDAGVTSASFERGRFLSRTNRALARGVRAWRFQEA
ncbi:hypothetical protein FEI13_02410 [Halomonas urmiana]|uniref:Uncharacterized protein n=1 Tax=Halomonas urmiana TaxID=490901 RepID=A0A5R8ML92_9GAMM|nr:hypothetical protein [Halomonas urmiana]TLF52982.1 hypothetical protein FEI13_02410 [Halomonas urmiana]